MRVRSIRVLLYCKDRFSFNTINFSREKQEQKILNSYQFLEKRIETKILQYTVILIILHSPKNQS